VERDSTPTEQQILVTCEGIRAGSEVVGLELQLLLAFVLPLDPERRNALHL